MKIENIKVDQTYKNYKELCNVLEIKVLAGKSKQLQLKEIERYCKYTKSGHSFTIVEIYNTPIPKIENRGKNISNNIYGQLIQLLILDLLAQKSNNGKLSISRSKLLQSFDMVNINYHFCGEHVRKLSKHLGTNENTVYDFYNTSNSNFKSSIETALKNLSDKRIILYNTVIRVNDLNEKRTRLASDEEIIIIMETEKLILKEMGFKKISQVRNSSKWKQFKMRVKGVLNNDNIDYYYIAYDISINEKYILEERSELVDLLLEDFKRIEYKNTLNAAIVLNLLNNAMKRHKNSFKSGKKSLFRSKNNYVDDIKKLINALIDSQTGNITYLIMNQKEENKEDQTEQIELTIDDLIQI